MTITALLLALALGAETSPDDGTGFDPKCTDCMWVSEGRYLGYLRQNDLAPFHAKLELTFSKDGVQLPPVRPEVRIVEGRFVPNVTVQAGKKLVRIVLLVQDPPPGYAYPRGPRALCVHGSGAAPCDLPTNPVPGDTESIPVDPGTMASIPIVLDALTVTSTPGEPLDRHRGRG